MPLLEVEGLKLHYQGASGEVRAVDGGSFSVEAGTAPGLAGGAGAGETRGEEGGFGRHFRWEKLAMVFQGAMESFNPVLKVGEQIIEPLLQRRVGRKEAGNQSRGR